MSMFGDIDDSKINTFFMQMLLSDVTMPHTHNKLSPITFGVFMDRNQIRTFDPRSVYDEACLRWKAFSSDHPEVFDGTVRKDNDLDMAEVPAENSWHILIDFFRRLLRFRKIKDFYFTMHYISHVCREFLDATMKCPNQKDMVCTRAVFTQIIGNILYDSIVPTQYFFLPVKSYVDATYPASLEIMAKKVETYILGHSAQSMQIEKLDELRSEIVKRELHDALSSIVKHKRNDQRVQDTLLKLTNAMRLYKIDQDAFELSETMVRDGVKSAIAIENLSEMGDKLAAGKISSDPDDVIDQLLDVWNIVSPPRKKSVLSKITDVFKKQKPEEMSNDIEAIQRTRKLNPS